MMTHKVPQSVEVTKHMVRTHLKKHFDIPSEFLNKLNVIVEIPCDCKYNSILVCAVCRDILVARIQTPVVCDCLRGLLDGQ